MAALLVAMSIAAVLMAVAMPAWKQMSRREKEEELIFRGLQYARALRLFGQKYANASAPNLDVLVEQRFLRKKFKDPITNDDFQLLLAGQAVPGMSTGTPPGPGQGGRGGGSGPLTTLSSQTGRGGSSGPLTTLSSQTGSGRGSSSPSTGGRGSGPGGSGTGFGNPSGPTGGIIGVASKSKDKSIRIYNGRNHYNEWAFINTPQTQAPGAGAPGTGIPGQRGGPQRGQPGTNPFGPQRGQPGTSPFDPQRGRGNPNAPPQPPPGRGRGVGPGASPLQPQSPFQPAQPILPGRGRGGG